jgi:hypothetical protein
LWYYIESSILLSIPEPTAQEPSRIRSTIQYPCSSWIFSISFPISIVLEVFAIDTRVIPKNYLNQTLRIPIEFIVYMTTPQMHSPSANPHKSPRVQHLYNFICKFSILSICKSYNFLDSYLHSIDTPQICRFIYF